MKVDPVDGEREPNAEEEAARASATPSTPYEVKPGLLYVGPANEARRVCWPDGSEDITDAHMVRRWSG